METEVKQVNGWAFTPWSERGVVQKSVNQLARVYHWEIRGFKIDSELGFSLQNQ